MSKPLPPITDFSLPPDLESSFDPVDLGRPPSFTNMEPPRELLAPPDFTPIILPLAPRLPTRTPATPFEFAHGEDLPIGLDSEWCEKNGKNLVLSYQLWAINRSGGEFRKVYYPKPGKRYRLEELISMFLEDCRNANLISTWPNKIFICSHFLRADITTFASFWDIKARLNGHGGSVVGQILTSSGYGVDETVLRSRKAHQAPIVLRDRHGTPQKTIIILIDTLFLAPNKSPLSLLGDMLGLPKVKLPAGFSIEKIDELLKADREAYERYANRDAEIAVKYALKVLAFLRAEFQVLELPRSLGSLSVQIFRLLLQESVSGSESGTEYYQRVFGLEVITIERWNAGQGKPRTQRVIQPSPARRLFEYLAINCYHGGRNECFMVGPTLLACWNDFDLKGAYTTGLCDMRIPDYSRAFTTTNPADFLGHVMGFAHVEFEFPRTTRFPCLPVRSEQYGLRFPLKGTAYVTAPEIELALSMGASVTINHGVIIPWVDGSPRLFEGFTHLIQQRRKAFPKRSLEETMIKEIGNSLYGKLAQGLGNKTAFDTATGLSKQIGPSAVTNPFMAAHTTGLIRAVCGELLSRIPANRAVVSVTTDGFLTNATLEELDQSGPLCRRYQALCQILHGGEDGKQVPMLELKHHARQLVSIKTRGQCTAIQGDTPPVLAKAGVKCAGTLEEQNDWILQLYLKREPGQKVDASHLISMREQWLTERDLVEVKKQVRLNYEYDQKRKLINPRMVDVAGVSHLACDTIPWETAADADYCRARFDGWRENNCLKTMEDWNSWDDVYESATALQGSKMRVCEDGSLGILSRILTRSLVQKAWFNHDMSYTEIAALLVSVGLAVSVDTCKNSKRSKLYEHVVPLTAPVIQVLARLVRQVPDLPLAPLFKPERLEEVHRRLAAIQPGVSNDEK